MHWHPDLAELHQRGFDTVLAWQSVNDDRACTSVLACSNHGFVAAAV